MTTETNNRFEKAFEALNTLKQDGSDSERCSAAMRALEGFIMTGASATVLESIETIGVTYNHLISEAATDASDMTAVVSETDAAELIRSLEDACKSVCEEETDRIFERLRNHHAKLPETEIGTLRKYRDWFAPRLLAETLSDIETLDQLYRNAPQGTSDREVSSSFDSSIPFFALFLSSEWEWVESSPVLLKGLMLPGEGPFDLFGDAVHEEIPRYVARILADDLDRIDDLIANPDLNPYVRWSTANSYMYLVRDGRISAKDAVARLEQLFERIKFPGADGRPGIGHVYEVSSGLLSVIMGIGGVPLMKVAPADLDWRFVDESIIHRKNLEDALKAGAKGMDGDALKNLPPTRTEDFLVSLRRWSAFITEPRRPRRAEPAMESTAVRAHPASPSVRMPSIAPEPVMQTTQLRRTEQTQRNARCPCGSGKKYKQCCMRTTTSAND